MYKKEKGVSVLPSRDAKLPFADTILGPVPANLLANYFSRLPAGRFFPLNVLVTAEAWEVQLSAVSRFIAFMFK